VRIMSNKITFDRVTRICNREYSVMLILNGKYSGISGYGTTPTKAKIDSKRSLRKLGRKKI